ncbi:unnamed protein product [Cercospora beticola]|nr:unnamed protein product [Cercospora beticola]
MEKAIRDQALQGKWGCSPHPSLQKAHLLFGARIIERPLRRPPTSSRYHGEKADKHRIDQSPAMSANLRHDIAVPIVTPATTFLTPSKAWSLTHRIRQLFKSSSVSATLSSSVIK